MGPEIECHPEDFMAETALEKLWLGMESDVVSTPTGSICVKYVANRAPDSSVRKFEKVLVLGINVNLPSSTKIGILIAEAFAFARLGRMGMQINCKRNWKQVLKPRSFLSCKNATVIRGKLLRPTTTFLHCSDYQKG